MNRFDRRLQHARERDQLLVPSNCIGTALYLVGEIEEDNPIDPWLAYHSFLRYFQEVQHPHKGCLVAYHRFNRIAHCAVVTSLKPLLVAQRRAFAAPVDIDVSLERLHAEYLDTQASYYRYYLPRNNFRRYGACADGNISAPSCKSLYKSAL